MNIARIACFLLVFLLSAAQAGAVTRHVPVDFPTIQQALNASSFGDCVMVAPGTYFENLSLGAAQTGVLLMSEAGPEVTILDGRQLGSVIEAVNVGGGTRISSFTITNGGSQVVAEHHCRESARRRRPSG